MTREEVQALRMARTLEGKLKTAAILDRWLEIYSGDEFPSLNVLHAQEQQDDRVFWLKGLNW